MNRYEELYRTILLEHDQVFAAQDTAALSAAIEEIAAAGRIFVTGA